MKIVGVIPSRMNSSRFPGKALADLRGRALLSFVCDAAENCPLLDEVYVATDSREIEDFCKSEGISVIFTKNVHDTPTSRVAEAAKGVDADLYVMIGGDEPLLTGEDIECVIRAALEYDKRRLCGEQGSPFVVNAVSNMTDAAETADETNIKIVYNDAKECIYASRNVIPRPQNNSDFCYKKFVGIGVYSKNALDFFTSTVKGPLEAAEECDLLRFIEHRVPVFLTSLPCHPCSVDTPQDLERVKCILAERDGTISHRYKAIIFDLDGTLLNTEEGILSSVRYTIDTMGYEPLSDEVMRTFIGPPVKVSLMAAYQLEDEEAAKATEVFRNRYKEHDLLKAVPYDGIIRLLADLKKLGYRMGVATLKRSDYAFDILKHFGIERFCESICGSDFESKMRKKDVLLKCLKEMNLSEKDALLIGDTASDGNGAREAGVDFMAVTFGFGGQSVKDWKDFHPVFTAQSAGEIGAFLKNH